MDHGTSRRWVVPAALAAAALALIASAMPAGAHPNVPRWYQYDKVTWEKTWRASPSLVPRHDTWHDDHPDATKAQNRDFHRVLRRPPPRLLRGQPDPPLRRARLHPARRAIRVRAGQGPRTVGRVLEDLRPLAPGLPHPGAHA